ncbi:glycosyltransferase [Streptomyces sp. NPDC059816]|uniref:glycosyltransferase n=1 Tax=Streptomyces sp. NPDC059816 TaxID=3346960 RepID=UPI00364F8012
MPAEPAPALTSEAVASETAAPAPAGSRSTGPPLVLHVVQPVDGGAARVVIDLVRAQCAGPDAVRVVVACPPDGPLAEAVTRAGACWLSWPATRSPGPALVGEVRALARLLDAVRPDLVHAHSAKAGLAARLAVRGRVPTVFQPHAWSFEAVGGPLALLGRCWERYGARWAHRIVCVSEAERVTGAAAGVRGRWTVIPNGVDTGRFRPGPAADPVSVSASVSASAPAEPPAAAEPTASAGALPAPRGTRDLRRALPALADTAPDAPLVVCVARLCRQKGQDVLLRAWREVARVVPEARLLLVGDGPDSAALRASSPEGVIFAGAVDDPRPWYRAADLVVLPSRWEGMALAPLEAMACGRPVLLTDVDGARESLPPGHAPYCLVPPGDPGALARATARLLLDAPRRTVLGQEGRRHVLTTHDVRQSADAVAAVYRELLGVERTQCRESINS